MITHEQLIEFGQELGYEGLEGGLCKGFINMLLQALLLMNDYQKKSIVHASIDNAAAKDLPLAIFYRRLELIKAHFVNGTDLVSEIETIKNKCKTVTLSEKEREYLEILSFYDDLLLYLEPNDHSDLFDRFISQHHIDKIYDYTLPTLASNSQDRLHILMEKNSFLDKKALSIFLDDIKNILDKKNFIIPICFENDNHAVLAWLHPETKSWEYLDINNGSDYYKNLKTVQLASELLSSFDSEDKPLVFHTSIVLNDCSIDKNDEVLLQLQQALSQFAASQPAVTLKQATFLNERNTGMLYLAASNDSIEDLNQLLNYSDNHLNNLNDQGLSALSIACQNHCYKSVERLLKETSLNSQQADHQGRTPLWYAAYYGHLDIVNLLLNTSKANINTADYLGMTPFYVACQNGHKEVVNAFLNCGALDCQQGLQGEISPWFAAYHQNHPEILRLLGQDPRMNINSKDSKGNTVLLKACKEGRFSIIEELLKNQKISINEANDKGVTPLFALCNAKDNQPRENINLFMHSSITKKGMGFFAVENILSETNETFKFISLLIKAGANITHKNRQGKTAFDIAVATYNEPAINALLAYAQEQTLQATSFMSTYSYNKLLNWGKNQPTALQMISSLQETLITHIPS